MTEIKSCPFCGGTANATDMLPRRWSVICHYCDAKVSSALGKSEAIAAWNRRTPTARDEALSALLESAQEAITVLDFAFEQGALDDETIKGLYVDPWGMLRDLKKNVAAMCDEVK